ncbi:DUF4097 family beta strand repeat-containing protein [Terrisporobacter mayombei]|uniref:DUF4097 domain-containing protein n=1 Tax=Terrisporobacter mayombei TaxID=1541 RepID=A0ABY9Q6G9_9FIRM|nr:DUF4097 family beta strand repeat-containing protein [Terrisporobacter mayombei]MCC3868726.1 DUF4097 domain-containing protein [Terrisporobacter mayombei]WMT83146.1 hypothetical protein TEMA_36450 [Terrisporobacter mayombei]
MNDKNWVKLRMILWSIVAILLALVLAVGIKGWGGNIFSGNISNRSFTISNMKVVKELKFDDINHIKYIKTDFNASDLIITENNEDNIKVIVKCNKTLKNNKYINADINSDTLKIEDFNNKSSRNIFGIFNGYSLQVEIKVPKSYKENITINNRVGDITFDSNLNLNNLSIDVVTGDIDGNQRINSNKIDINNKVGDVNFNYLYGKEVTIKGKTGDIDIDKFSGKGSIESQVGDITCDIENLNGDFSIKSKVGDVELYTNKNLSFIFEGNKNFGDLDTGLKFNNVSQSSDSFTGQYGNDPVNKIIANVKTGDISIND